MQATARTARASRLLSPRRRPFSVQCATRSKWTTGPSPPRLPKEEQEIFEKLQGQSTGAFSTPRTADDAAQDAQLDATATGAAQGQSSDVDTMLEQLRQKAGLAANGEGQELHPNVRMGAPPEFEGDVNPKTGEVGGPKNEPLRWGETSDWSYNGRVTDF